MSDATVVFDFGEVEIIYKLMRNVNEKASVSKFYVPFQIENKIHTLIINRKKKKKKTMK